MPVQYDSVVEEHNAVRTTAGIFDVSHLGRFEVSGQGALELLRSQLCNDISKIEPGRAQYTMALNDRGGIEDDIIVWWLESERFWMMPNGTNFDEIVDRFKDAAQGAVEFRDVRSDTVLLAIQGPDAPALVEAVLGFTPGRFKVEAGMFEGEPATAAGTGYTGERGAEVCVPITVAEPLWNAFVNAGAKPAALGARDTLRLEMGFPLWGQDLLETTTPVEAGLSWVVAWDHEFIGKSALEAIRNNPPSRLVAFTIEGRAIPRHGYEVRTDSGVGEITSGNYSPTLGHGIGLAYVFPPPKEGESMAVSIRGKAVPATIVTLPFLQK
jgi:aminomethyltransferase